VEALQAAVQWHSAEAVMVGHAIPGGIVAHRALGPGRYIVKVHGSELEYTIRHQDRYLRLAAEGLIGARAVVGPSEDVLTRTAELVPESRPLHRVISPGVDLDAFRPRARAEALLEVATKLDKDGAAKGGRPAGTDERVSEALADRDAKALHDLALSYDQDAPDAEAPERLRALAGYGGPVAGFIGKLIPQKGPHLLIQALALLPADARALVIGFGQFREWFAALVHALDAGDRDAASWVSRSVDLELELSATDARSARGLGERVTFTGRLDHLYAPEALAAADVLVVPSVLPEAFGIVAIEGAASGALPLVAGHSGLVEIARLLETAVNRPGLFSFEPGPGAVRRLADGLSRLLFLADDERRELREAVRECAQATWSWERTALSLLAAAT
jgi:glycosyltransferase involved in cell wall biosynthesis